MRDDMTSTHPIDEPFRRDVPRIAFGLVLIALGGVNLLARLDLLPTHLHIGELWPVIFFVLALVALSKFDVGGFLVFSALGTLFFLPKIRPDISFTDILAQWPLFLVAIGVWTVLQSFLPEKKSKSKSRAEGEEEAHPGSLAIFRTVTWRPRSQNYRGDQVTAIVGGYKLDLEKADLAPEGAVVEVFSFWGGVEILLPDTWAVDVRVVPFMGGFDEKGRSGRPVPADAPRLLIRGFVVMGGLEVKH